MTHSAKFYVALVILFSVLGLFLLVACQDTEPVDLTLVAMGPTLTYQVEIVNIMTSQALTPRPTRERTRYTAWPTARPSLPTPDPNASPTPPVPNSVAIPAGVAPVLDGQLGEGEWTDAAALTVAITAEWPVTVFFQHDAANLYLVYTGLDADPIAIFPELFLDSFPDEQEIWDGNNWWFHLSTGPCWGQGNDILWQNCGQPTNWSTTTLAQNGAVVEMQIPYRTINLRPGSSGPMGLLLSFFSLTANDTEQRLLWPMNSEWERPNTWGVAVPEDGW